MKKLFYIMSFVAIGMLGACTDYAEDIRNVSDRLDKLEQGRISTIEQQITSINGSLETLRAMDAELKGYIKNLENAASDLQRQIDEVNTALAALESDLEGQISASEQKVLNELNTVKTALEAQLTTINNTIATLQAKDEELEKKIADLHKYVDDEIAATEDWASATFSTLEQYEATQTAISEINALIKSTQESIAALEEKLNKKIADDIAAAVAGVNADIAAKVIEITEAYTAAIQTAKNDITAAYTDAIKAAITASEASMKEWVNGVLAEGYYTKAEIDGKLTALQTQVTEGDAALQKEIDALTAALAKAESDLTAAYKKAIEDAITENNGKISAEIAAAVKTAQDNLQAQIDAINSEMEKIKTRLDIIEADINSINQQITAINISIDDLKGVDVALQQLIDDLETKAADLQMQLDDNASADAAAKQALESEIANLKTLIAALQSKDTELEQKISDLQAYVDGEISATEDWANATFATLAQYADMQQEIADLKTLIDKNKADIEAAYTQAIAEAIAASEISMKEWVNGELQKVYAEIASVQASLDALAASVATDDELAAAATAQQAALEQAKSDLTAAYEAAIKKAIEENNGVIDDAISAAITAATSDLQNEIGSIKSEISSIKSRLDALEKNFANRIQSLKYLPEYNDGKATMDYVVRTLNLDFIISPAQLAATLKQQFDADNGVIKAFVRYTKTRAAGDIVEQKVSAMSVDENGLFTLTIEEQGLSDEFWTGALDAVVYVQIIDQNGNNVVSDMIPMVADGVTIQQLATPTNIKTEQIARGVLRVSWDPVLNADGYEFYDGDTSGNQYLPIDNCYYDIEYTEGLVGTYREFGVKAASNSLLYTTSEPYESHFTFPELLPEPQPAMTIEYEATEQLTIAEGVFGNGVTYTHTFADGKGTITFDSSVTSYSIANFAFYETTTLKTIIFSEGLTSIGNYAFTANSLLTKVVITGDVVKIGNAAFDGCSSLTTVEYYGTTAPIVGVNVFNGTAISFVSVTDSYPSSTFGGIRARKVL